jgi:lipoprotein-releasing system permease protein
VRQRIHSGSAHLTVMSFQDAVFEDVDDLLDRIREVPGVNAAGPVLHTPGMLMLPDMGSPGFAEIQGVDPAAHAAVILGERSVESNPFAALSRPTTSDRAGIVVGEQLAIRVGALEGDLVRVLVPQVTLAPWGPQPRSQIFEVVGTYRSEHFQEDSQRAYVSIAAARKLLRADNRASWVELRLDDLRRLAPMKRTLRDGLGPPWTVIDLLEQNEDLLKALNTEKLVLFLAIGLIVVVASLNIVSTLILMVTDKVKEIGTLSAMGAKPSGIAAVFVLQGLVIGLVGTLSGLLTGSALAIWLDRYQIIKLDPDVYYLSHLPFLLRPLDLTFVGGVALMISLLATIYPATRAARLDPVEAIRYE